ncbi:MAG TPA: glycosyltransferase family 4 protein [Chthoniobacterales bacterium]|nr:glycosyltransferase family 4 protein [Chthoniobacterales bacterium]
MRILFSSYLFDPSVGGIETVSKILAEEFAKGGHEVQVITQSPGGQIAGANYKLIRRPSLSEIFRLLKWCDIFFQNNISLRSLIPALALRKPTVVVHQTWLQNVHGGIGWQNHLKQLLLRFVVNVAISKAVADRLNVDSIVIGNPYDETVFRLMPGVIRDKTIVFVGRLVSDKGVDLLLHALEVLKRDGILADLTIVGSGPEEMNLRKLAADLGLSEQVAFSGQKSGAPLAQILNQHRILAVPSRWAEPFGVVALEGIACGCVIVGSRDGGLKEAIGGCGVTFENGNVTELAAQLKRMIKDADARTLLLRNAEEHLMKFQSNRVAAAYLELMGKRVP